MNAESPLCKIVTIGAYGFTEEKFFASLHAAGVDVLCDVRMRRSVRGPAYRFANSGYLQEKLAQMGIRYVHMKDLAPTDAVRGLQHQADKQNRVTKRQRTLLSQQFVQAYTDACLKGLDADEFLKRLGPACRVVALFCVEGHPEACHRMLLADHLAMHFRVEVQHLRPSDDRVVDRTRC